MRLQLSGRYLVTGPLVTCGRAGIRPTGRQGSGIGCGRGWWGGARVCPHRGRSGRCPGRHDPAEAFGSMLAGVRYWPMLAGGRYWPMLAGGRH